MSPSSTPAITVSDCFKLIRCQVKEEHRDPFHQGQSAWQATSEISGCGGQIGGWSQINPSRALILGLWRDESAHRDFMSQDHDRIYQQSGQAPWIQRMETQLWRRVANLEEPCPLLAAHLAEVDFLRVVTAQLLPGAARREHFLATQPQLWAPAMKLAGCLGFGVGEDPDDPLRLLLISLWNDEDTHRQWREEGFRELWYEADVESDCDSITGDIIPVIPAWRVH